MRTLKTKFHYKPDDGFTVENGYVKEVEALGEKLGIELEKLGYRITIPSFTDWGYAFNATIAGKTVSVIIEIDNLDQGSFGITLKPDKKWYQIISSFEYEVELVLSQIKHLDLKMNINSKRNHLSSS